MSEYMNQMVKKMGGEFLKPLEAFHENLANTKAWIFDWDGVFNDGTKGEHTSGSPYSEPDSMGINLLRFSHWLKHGKMPITAIITGENNMAAFRLARREFFEGVYFRFTSKIDAANHISQQFGVPINQMAFTMDDVLDLPLAQHCGLRFLVRRNASLFFQDFVAKNNFADYITGNFGNTHAIREICELIIYLNGNFDTVMKERIIYSGIYQDYLAEKRKIDAKFYTWENGALCQKEML